MSSMNASLEKDRVVGTQSTDVKIRAVAAESGANENGSWSTAPLQLPNLALRSAFAAGAKAAGRLNSALISQKEHEDLLSERQMLLDKLFSEEITAAEENRLEYVRWSLDRIEDAKHGAALDILEAQAEAYENLLVELGNFYQHLDNRVQKPKK